MKHVLLLLIFLFSSKIILSQLPDGFDIKAAYQTAKEKGIPQSDIEGYVKFLHADYLSHKGHASASTHNSADVYDMGTIYVNGNNGSIFKTITPPNNTPQNAYCPNAGFEQLNFTNWTGGYGSVTNGGVGAPFPIYNQTGATIMNGAGNNVGLTNTTNYHTIMTTPATNSIYPNCVGWDSIACKVVGTQTVSEIQLVSPFGAPSSVRMNGAVANYRASKLNYLMTLNPNNKSFSVSYALVLQNGSHTADDQPYFSVKVTDQNGNPVPGCSVYTVTCNASLTNTASPMYDPTWTNSVIGFDIMYRKWATYAFDFTNYPSITAVNVEFYVGGCAQGGHWGYAYVDAECSQGGAVASFCAGSNASVLSAPAGYSTYQWVGPGGPISIANGGNAMTATISPVTAGQVFTCNVTAPNGCLSSFQTTVSITTVSITGVGSTPSCPNGFSGTAYVNATGSSLGYSYQWINSLGTQVGTTQTATGLAPGNYTVIVNSPMCGSATTTVNVGISAPAFYGLQAPYCGTVAWITKNGGTNYTWYTASPLAVIPGATSSSLTINNPVNGAQYFLVYTTASGCKDSIKYTLTQQPGGNIYASNIKSICPGNNNSYAVINLQTAATAPYSYTVTGPGGYSHTLNNTSAIKDSITGLSIGTYSATVFDGQCLYNTTFTVNPFVYTFTLTPTNTVICTPLSTSLTVNFGNTTPATCGLSGSGGCTTPNLITIGNGTQINSSTTYPAIYGNWYKNSRHQILYLASELLAAGVQPGKISSIAWNVAMTAGTTTYPNFTIKMKCTNVNDLGTSTAFDNVGLTQVYSAPSVNVVVGWNTYNFPVAYEWDGVSNILVDVCNDLTASYTNNSSTYYTATPFNSVRWFNSDVTVACPYTTSSGYTPNTTYRPNIRFGNCGGSNPSLFSYTWTPTTGLNPTNTYTTIANPTVTTVYNVQVEPIGQTNCMQTQSSTVNVIVPVPATVTPVGPFCTNNATAITLTATPTGGTWSGVGVTSAGVLTPSLATVGNNTYTYSIGTGSCASIGNTTVSIEQYVPSTIGGTVNPMCLPASTVDLSTALTTSTLGTGVWSGPGVTGNIFDPTVSGAGTHTLTYSTNSTPTTSLCPSSSTISVQVNSATQPTITSVGPYCSNGSIVTMSVTPSGGTWVAGNGISASGSFDPSTASVGNNTYTYTVGSSTCSATETTSITVVQFVPAVITGTVGPNCIYDALTNLQTLTQFPGGTWTGAGVSSDTFTPASAGAGTHVLTYSTNPSPLLYCGSTATMEVVVNPKPEANAIPNITQGCNPVTINYSSTTVNTGTMVWDFGDGNTATGLSVTHTYTVPGTYTATITYTDNVGCKDTSTATSAIDVYPMPVASFDPSLTETTVVDGQVEFTNTSTVLADNTYNWDIGGLYSSTNINESYLFANSGDYTVTLIATTNHGCVDDTSIVIFVKPDVVLYVPNAFTPGNGDGLNDVFQIFLPPTGVDYSTFQLYIFDRWGEMIYKTNDVNLFWNGRKNNSGPILKQDAYVYKIYFKDELGKQYQKLGHVFLMKK